jgi:membrane-bound lytic murein transglycosylase D
METEAVPGREISPGQLTMAHMRVEERSRKARIRGGRRPGPGGVVIVRKGDTLGRLAKRHRVRMKELATANGLTPRSILKVGSRLVLPEPFRAARSRTARAAVRKVSGGTKSSSSAEAVRDVRKRTTRYKVRKGDTLGRIARVYGVTVERIADRNRLNKSKMIRPGLVLVIPPES